MSHDRRCHRMACRKFRVVREGARSGVTERRGEKVKGGNERCIYIKRERTKMGFEKCLVLFVCTI